MSLSCDKSWRKSLSRDDRAPTSSGPGDVPGDCAVCHGSGIEPWISCDGITADWIHTHRRALRSRSRSWSLSNLQFSLPDILHGIRDERIELEVRVRGTVQGNGFVDLAVRFPDELEPEQEQTTFPLSKPPRKDPFVFLSWESHAARSIFRASILMGVRLLVFGFIVTTGLFFAKSAFTRT